MKRMKRPSKRRLSAKQVVPFAAQLFDMLEDAERLRFNHIISWLPNGLGFKVHRQSELVNEILPNYFDNQRKYKSFQRQLNMYEFKMLRKAAKGSGLEKYKGAFFHPLFTRGDRESSFRILRKSLLGKSTSLSNKSLASPRFITSTSGRQSHNIKTTVHTDRPCSSTQQEEQRRISFPNHVISGQSENHMASSPLSTLRGENHNQIDTETAVGDTFSGSSGLPTSSDTHFACDALVGSPHYSAAQATDQHALLGWFSTSEKESDDQHHSTLQIRKQTPNQATSQQRASCFSPVPTFPMALDDVPCLCASSQDNSLRWAASWHSSSCIPSRIDDGGVIDEIITTFAIVEEGMSGEAKDKLCKYS